MVNTASIAIPCLNEAKALRGNFPRRVGHLRTLPATHWDIVVVDNNNARRIRSLVSIRRIAISMANCVAARAMTDQRI